MADKSSDKNSNGELEHTSESNYHLQKTEEQHEQPTRPFLCCSSENSINIKQNSLFPTGKDIRQKIVSRVKSWSNREKNLPNHNSDVETVVMNSTQNTDDASPELVLRKKNSLNNLGHDEKSHYSDESGSRSCTLFSFDKKNRKNRKDSLRKRKNCMFDAKTLKRDANSLRKNEKSTPSKPAIDLKAVEDGYDKKYKVLPRSNKTVLFINEVYVVYFKGDDVICESKEPLKKDTEQQRRNKEMRQGYLLKTQKKYNICLY